MQCKEITNQQEWNGFINEVKPNTFLHTWEWSEFEANLKRQVFRIGVYEGETLVAVSLWSKITARRGTFLLCPHGPIVAPQYKNKLEEILTTIKEKIVEIGKAETCDFIRISTLIVDTTEHQAIFKKFGFKDAPIHMHSELAWIIDVTQSEEDILKNMKKNTRYSVRKAEKDGVEIVKSESMDDFEKFWDIYMTTATRQNFTPYSYEYLKKEFELFFATKHAVLFFGTYQGVAVSTAFVVYANGSGYYHHGASNQKFPSITASEMVQWAAIKEAKARGCERYNFWGIVPETATTHPWHGLSKFKRGFGGYAEQYVHAQDLVLTPKYWLNYMVEKVRKIRRRL
jgi:lipid II:glycine glycyltransferase (peptidoglycan interpeptide bridge formation enzyme)